MLNHQETIEPLRHRNDGHTGQAHVAERGGLNVGPARKAYPLNLFCEIYHTGPTKAREEIAAGRLHAVKMGSKLLIPVEAAEAWFRSLPPATSQAAA